MVRKPFQLSYLSCKGSRHGLSHASWKTLLPVSVAAPLVASSLSSNISSRFDLHHRDFDMIPFSNPLLYISPILMASGMLCLCSVRVLVRWLYCLFQKGATTQSNGRRCTLCSLTPSGVSITYSCLCWVLERYSSKANITTKKERRKQRRSMRNPPWPRTMQRPVLTHPR